MEGNYGSSIIIFNRTGVREASYNGILIFNWIYICHIALSFFFRWEPIISAFTIILFTLHSQPCLSSLFSLIFLFFLFYSSSLKFMGTMKKICKIVWIGCEEKIHRLWRQTGGWEKLRKRKVFLWFATLCDFEVEEQDVFIRLKKRVWKSRKRRRL